MHIFHHFFEGKELFPVNRLSFIVILHNSVAAAFCAVKAAYFIRIRIKIYSRFNPPAAFVSQNLSLFYINFSITALKMLIKSNAAILLLTAAF